MSSPCTHNDSLQLPYQQLFINCHNSTQHCWVEYSWPCWVEPPGKALVLSAGMSSVAWDLILAPGMEGVGWVTLLPSLVYVSWFMGLLRSACASCVNDAVLQCSHCAASRGCVRSMSVPLSAPAVRPVMQLCMGQHTVVQLWTGLHYCHAVMHGTTCKATVDGGPPELRGNEN